MASSSESDSSDEQPEPEDIIQIRQLEQELQATPTTILSKLSPEDQTRYENIRSALALNKELTQKTAAFERHLIVLLKECRERLGVIQAELNARLPEKPEVGFRYANCGKPYFRDRDNCPPPDNVDTITMQSTGMYDFTQVQSVTGWTIGDKTGFLKQILTISQQMRKDELSSKLSELKRRLKTEDCKQIEKDIVKLKKEMEQVKNLPLEAVAKPIDYEYDWEYIAGMLGERHSPQEYRSFWKLYLHPSINKKTWGRSEHNRLDEIIKFFRYNDWDEIAKTLNTGRTGYQCFIYFRSNLSKSLTGAKWTKEEEEYLTRLVEYYRQDDYIPWSKVAAHMDNRKKIQIYNKYHRLVEVRKGRFLPEEDDVILTFVKTYGKKFKELTNYLPGRSASQIRTRYRVLSSGAVSVVWTVKDDKKLLQMTANQDSMLINYADLTKYFPGKGRNQLRSRYNTLTRWMKRNPNRDVSFAPRRGSRRLCHGHGNIDLNEAVTNLRKRIQTDIDNFKSNRITKDSPEEAIEQAIVTTLVTETVTEEAVESEILEFSDQNIGIINENNLKNVLILLRANLRKHLFTSSEYHVQYPHLVQEHEAQPLVVKMKCYSKKSDVNPIPVDELTPPSVSIWGNPLSVTESVLPPNYATITGCRRLMAFATSTEQQNDNHINLSQIMRKNSIAKEHIELFMERFSTLFLWPVLLSSVNPPTPKNKMVSNPEPSPPKKIQPTTIDTTGVTIPTRVKSCKDNETIDLKDTEDRNDIIVTTYVGNDDFMYINETPEEKCPDDIKYCVPRKAAKK